MMVRRAMGCLAFAGCTAMAGQALAQRGQFEHLLVLPAESVQVDGRLDEWMMDAAVPVRVTEATAQQRSARFAAMYDAEALYLAASVRDDTPMVNEHDPAASAEKGWDADSCQFRLILDPDRPYPARASTFDQPPSADPAIVHLSMWYFTGGARAALTLKTGMTYDAPTGLPGGLAPEAGYEATYRKWEDGEGYDFEYRIPWSTLGAAGPLQAGDLVSGTVQFNWGEASGLSTLGNAGWAYEIMHTPGFPFQDAGTWGRLVFMPGRWAPAGLYAREAGGEPTPIELAFETPRAGHVTVTLFDEQNRIVRTVVAGERRDAGRQVAAWDGLDDWGEPIQPGTYRWAGIVRDPIATRWVMSVHNAGQPPYPTDDGTGGWGGDHGWPTASAPLADGLLLGWHAAEAGWGVIRVDADGRKRWGIRQPARHLAADPEAGRFYLTPGEGFSSDAGVQARSLADGRSLSFAGGRASAQVPPQLVERGIEPSGLAVLGGRLFTAFEQADLIAVNDATSGDLIETWPAPAPRALASSPDGELLAVSAGAVRAWTGSAWRTVIDADDPHLADPMALAVDSRGRLFVANGGARQDVAVFDAEGRWLRHIGRPGGRNRIGAYQPDGMLEPSSLSIGPRGRLWVTEHIDAPKRISVWDVDSGELEREFFGGGSYSTAVWMDPDRPGEALCHNVLWEVDLDRGRSSPRATVGRYEPGRFMFPPPSHAPHHLRSFTASDGRQYAFVQHYVGELKQHYHTLFRREGDLFVPIAAQIETPPDDHRHRLREHPAMALLADADAWPARHYGWQDRDADQQIDADELTEIPTDHRQNFFDWVDADLNLWSGSGHVWRPIGRDDDARPRYAMDQPQRTDIRATNGGDQIWIDPASGNLFVVNHVHTAEQGWRPSYWASYDRSLRERWRQAALPFYDAMRRPLEDIRGRMWSATAPLGVADGVTGVATYFGQFQLFTTGGIYIDTLFRDIRQGQLGADTIAAETFSGQIVRPRGDERFFVLGGDQDGRITQVTGLDSIEPLPGGSYQVDESMASTAASNAARGGEGRSGPPIAHLAASASRIEEATAMRATLDGWRSIEARLAHDPAGLRVRAVVHSPHPFVNASADAQLAFKGGNTLDLQWGPLVGDAVDRDAPGVGDRRLLISRFDGRPRAVLFVPRDGGESEPAIVLRSPTGVERFARIDDVSSRVSVEVGPAPDGAAGFTVEALIPWDVLGFETFSTPRRFDVGYIFGNAQGTQAADRAYWSNRSLTARITNDVPHESRLEPARWGLALPDPAARSKKE